MTSAQPPPLPSDFFTMIMLFVGGLVGIIVVGIIVLIIGYAYKRQIIGQGEKEGIFIEDNSPSKRLQSRCSNWWVILLCILLIVMVVAPGLFIGSIIVFSVQILWGFLYFWAFGIPIFFIMITAVDMIYYRRQLTEGRSGETTPPKILTSHQQPPAPTEYTPRVIDFCRSCKAPLFEEAQYCPYCGKKT